MNLDINRYNEITKVIEIMTHELKTPLISVLFNIQSIKRILNEEVENSPELLKKKILSIEAKINLMSSLLEYLLDLAQTQISEIHIRKNLTRTHYLLSEVVNSSKKLDHPKVVKIENFESCQYCTIECDKDRLLQVFSNIIANLINFNPKQGTVKLSTRTNGNFAQFIIKDEGSTWESNYLNTIFDNFRLTKIENIERMSLGLALSKWIIEAHHGKI